MKILITGRSCFANTLAKREMFIAIWIDVDKDCFGVESLVKAVLK